MLIRIFNSAFKKQDSLTPSFEADENIYALYISSFGVCIYVQCFFDVVRNHSSNKKYLLELIKRRSRVHENIMLPERALIFEQ